MALRLTELQTRVQRRRTSGQPRNGGKPAPAREYPVPAPPPEAMWRRPSAMTGPAANAGGLAEKLIANGAPPEEANRLAAAIARIEMAEAASLARPFTAREPVPLPAARTASQEAADTILSFLRWTPLGLAIEGAFAFCNETNAAVSFGVGYLVGLGAGGGQAVGLVFGPNRTIGYFSSLGRVLGWVASVSGSITFSAIRGGMAAFNGQSVTVGFTVGAENPGEPLSPGVGYHHVYNMSGAWIGISGEVSLSAGLSPIEVIRGEWQTASQTVQAHSLAIAGNGSGRRYAALTNGRSASLSVPGSIAASTTSGFVSELIAAFQRGKERSELFTLGVPHTDFFPFSAICQIESSIGKGTGFFISSDRIVTAAHVVQDGSGSSPANATINVGRNGASSLKSFSIPSSNWSVHPSHNPSSPTDSFDLAVIKVSEPPPNNLFFDLINFSPAADTPVAVCGYASGNGRVDVNLQNIDIGRIVEARQDLESMRVEVLALTGSSGGPAFIEGPYMSGDHDPSSIPVMGLLVSGPTDIDNNICLITPDKVDWLRSA